MDCIRFRFSNSETPSLNVGLPNIAAWSEAIAIEASVPGKENVLVKIASKSKSERSSQQVWCRVIRERVTTVWRSLVVISPQFVVRSHLPRPLILHLTTPATHHTQQFVIPGGGCSEYLKGCESSLSHHLTFQLRPDLPQSSPPIPLHRAMADQMRLAQPRESVDLTKYIQQLFQTPAQRWPYIHMEGVKGKYTFLCTDQPKIDLQVGFSGLHPMLSTVVVDLRPWALIINHTSAELFVQDGPPMEPQNEDASCNRWFIPNNGVFAPPKLDGVFRFGVMEEQVSYCTNILQISKEDRWYTLKFEGRLPRNGTTNITIQTSSRIYYITVVSNFEENIQVMHLLPTFSIGNNTKEKFALRPMAVHKVASGSGSLNSKQVPISYITAITENKPLLELPLLYFSILPVNRTTTNDDERGTTDFSKCLQIGQEKAFSEPVLLGEVVSDDFNDQRLSFSLPVLRDDSIDRSTSLYSCNKAYLVTCHVYRGCMKLVIQDDNEPQFIVYNNTMTTLILGEYCAVLIFLLLTDLWRKLWKVKGLVFIFHCP